MKSIVYTLTLFLILGVNQVHGGMQKLQYDSNGNLISGQGLFYEYNDANKLVRVRTGSSDGKVISQYWYDYKGQRVKKIENGVTTYYLGKRYEEKRGQSINEKTNYYFAGPQRVAKKVQTDDKPVKTYYYLNNHLGSTDYVIEDTGATIDQAKYYPYGKLRSNNSEEYGYTGKEKDKATGLNYYEARYYNSNSRHFTQADTVTPNVYDPQSLNRYSYVKNNPVKYIDPSGHTSEWGQKAWSTAKKWGGRLNPVTAFSSVGALELAITPSTSGHQWKSDYNRALFHYQASESARMQKETANILRNQKESVVPYLEGTQALGEIAGGALRILAGDVAGGSYSIAKGTYRLGVAHSKEMGWVDTHVSSDIWHAPSEIATSQGYTDLGHNLENGADIINLFESAKNVFVDPYKSLNSVKSLGDLSQTMFEFSADLYGFSHEAVDNARKLK